MSKLLFYGTQIYGLRRKKKVHICNFTSQKRFVFLSGYSLRGTNNYFYSKKWRVEGFNEDEENDKTKWALLARNTSSERNYCNNVANNCGSTAYATYSVDLLNKGFQYIRFTGEEASDGGGSSCRFGTSAIELYGILSKTGIKRTKNLCSQKACLIYKSDNIMILSFILVCCS